MNGNLSRSLLVLAATSWVLASGCQRATELQWTSSKDVLKLDAKLQTAVQTELRKACGTPARPRLIGQTDDRQAAHLAFGRQVYQDRCAGCHGVTGDGAGPAAEYLYPRPRDYRRGLFKFASTPYGAKPLREDLVRTVRRGALGTSMPSFKFLTPEEIEAVVDYVLVLTHRGELETLLALEADGEDAVDPANVPEHVQEILAQWNKAPEQFVHPLSRETASTPESIERGKQAFLSETAGCYKCHGRDGRGQPIDNPESFKDVWDQPTRAADLSAGMFHGGRDPEVIYRRIYSGITGTPMPAFSTKLADQPETFWDLVHYVQFISGARRREVLADHEAYHQRVVTAAQAGGR